MDGTLVKTDIAQELFLQSCKSLTGILELLSLIPKGRSHIKHHLANSTDFSAEYLPYNEDVLDYLKTEKQKGRELVLATASDGLIASKVAEHLQLFDAVVASNPGSNLKGRKKLTAILEHCDQGKFEYIGDSKSDLPIWKQAAACGFVNRGKRLEKGVPDKPVSFSTTHREKVTKHLLEAMRPHQWAKNILIFLPIFFAHQYFNPQAIIAALILFFCFSLSASSIYIVNDLLDIEADRQHKRKKNRPFASGKLIPHEGVLLAFTLLAIAFSIAFLFLNLKSVLVLLAYLVITNTYSFYLKNKSTIDVITLTLLYTTRIFAGGVATGIAISPWLLNFSLFFFLSLAYMKRYIELAKSDSDRRLPGRNYHKDESDVILTTGIVNGGIAVFTLSLYLNSDFVISSYSSPGLLWLVCPVLLFWVYRAWMWTKRNKIDDDPVVFAIRDKISLLAATLIVCLVVIAKYADVEGYL
jgi:4-hydroxybenzoate polyprenyltransferase